MKTKYTDEIVDTICEQIATTNKSMRTICKEVGIGYRTHLDWLRDKPEYTHQYAQAKEAQADLLAEEILEISDDSSNDLIPSADGDKPNSAAIQRSRLQVDARKWIASKLKPKKYGDKTDITSDGEKIQTPIIDMSKWK